MKTAQWATYDGSGRIAISPAPRGARRGYRRSPVLYFNNSETASQAMIDIAFNMADPGDVLRMLHVLVYPYEPVLMGVADPDVESYRRQMARWLSFHWGEHIEELDPQTYRARKQTHATLSGLSMRGLKFEPQVQKLEELAKDRA